MLYDPKWEQKTKAAPSREGFVAWLERQPPDGEYQYWCTDCAIGLYLRSIGTSMLNAIMPHGKIIHEMNMTITRSAPHTFGAALERARATAQ